LTFTFCSLVPGRYSAVSGQDIQYWLCRMEPTGTHAQSDNACLRTYGFGCSTRAKTEAIWNAPLEETPRIPGVYVFVYCSYTQGSQFQTEQQEIPQPATLYNSSWLKDNKRKNWILQPATDHYTSRDIAGCLLKLKTLLYSCASSNSILAIFVGPKPDTLQSI